MRPKEKREIIFASYGFACCCVACTGLKAFGKISLIKLYILNNISFTDVRWEEKRENLRLFLENQRMQELDEEEQQQMARWENDQFHPVLMT